MSLDKAIKYGKEKRQPYRRAKAIDPWCRNHGNCRWCEESRLHKNKKRDISAKYISCNFVSSNEFAS